MGCLGLLVNLNVLSKVKSQLPRFETANFYTNAKFSVLGRPIVQQAPPPFYNPLPQTQHVDLNSGILVESSYF